MALSANKDVPFKDGKIIAVPVKAGQHIYQGAIVCVDATGYALPGSDTSGLKFIGIAAAEADNTNGGDGDVLVKVFRTGVHLLATSGASQADILADVYVSDDETVAKTTTNSIKVGKIVQIESASEVWVDITQ